MLVVKNDRIFSLELLRFIAAFTVFFGHYVHFYMYFKIPLTQGIFFTVNHPYGALAVPIFFMISGAIFIHTYLEQISNNQISFVRFMQKRLARLYPLHILTLLFVAVLQAIFYLHSHQYFIYQFNNLKHFVLNLLFISHWGMEDGHGFNAPIWSVSHEMFLYMMFFLVCYILRFNKRVGVIFLIVCLITALLQHFTTNLLAKSAFCFLFGSLVYIFVSTALSIGNRYWQAMTILFGAGFLFLINSFLSKHGLPYGAIGPLLIGGGLILDSQIKFNSNSFFWRISIFFANISYSTYLLHFPVQLLLLLFSSTVFVLDFSSTYVLLLYVFLVISVSVYSFQFFETPMKRKLSNY